MIERTRSTDKNDINKLEDKIKALETQINKTKAIYYNINKKTPTEAVIGGVNRGAVLWETEPAGSSLYPL